jgi:ribonuclease VapC
MQNIFVLDSFAVLAFLGEEKGYDQVSRLLHDATDHKAEIVMSAINLGEVWYQVARDFSSDRADEIVAELIGLEIEVVGVDWALARQAAVFKSKGGISYADCYAAALAKAHGATVVTGDKEFKRVENEVKVLWL